jgi:type IV secretory pathway TrbD component
MEGCGAALLVRRFVERRRRQSTAALAATAANGCSGDGASASARGGSSGSCWARLMPVMDGGVDRLVRSSGLLLATVGVVGTLWCIGLHFVAVLPHFVGHRPLESLAGVCHLAFSVFLAHGGFYNYYKVPPALVSFLLILFIFYFHFS